MTKVQKIKKLLNVSEHLRLGQFIWNQMKMHADAWEAPEANVLFFISDEDLEEVLSKK